MQDMKLGAVESRFADIIWENAPISSGMLVKLCQEELSWKKPTTYTVLRKLCEKGIFENRDGTVVVRITREEFYALQTEQFVEENFQGSLPAFLAAFMGRKKLSRNEIAALQQLIDDQKKEEENG